MDADVSIGVNRRASAVPYLGGMRLTRYSLLLRTKFTKWSNLYSFMAKDGRARLQPCRNPPRRGKRSLAGGERSEPPDRIGVTIRTPAGVAGVPRAPAGARWSRRHGFQGFAKGAHPWLSSSRSFGADRTTEVVPSRSHFHSQWRAAA